MITDKNKQFLKNLFYIAIPITIQAIIQNSFSLVDQLMVGQLGETSINAIGFGSKLSFIFFLALAGITSATSIYSSQFFGSKDNKKLGSVVGLTLSSASIITLLAIIISIFFPKNMMSFFTTDSSVIAVGAKYMRILALGFIPVVFINTFSAVLRSCGDSKTPMITGFISVILNTVLNYILIIGVGDFSGMGVLGAGIATSISRCVEFFILSYLFFKSNLFSFNFKACFTFDKKLFSMFNLTMLPLLINEGLWAIGDSVFSAIYGRIGGVQSAAMISTFPLQSLSFGIMSGIAAASGIMIGNLLGKDDKEEAYNMGKKFIFIGIICSLFVGVSISLFGSYYIDFMNISPEAKSFASKILNVFSIVLFVKVSNMIIAGGILRSGGDTKIILVMEMIGMWLIGVPVGFLVSKHTNLPIHLIYFFISLEELFRMMFGLKLFRNKSWMKNVNNQLEEVA